MVEESVLEGDVAQDRGMAMWKYFEARQGRSGTFGEVGDVDVLMCMPQMSLVTGQNLFIDGYVSMLSSSAAIADCAFSGFTINESDS